MSNLSKKEYKTIDIMRTNEGYYMGVSPDWIEKITIGKAGSGWLVSVSLETNIGFEEESEVFQNEWAAIEFARNFLFKRGFYIEFI